MKIKLTFLLFMVFISLKAQESISGVTTDATGQPLPGVNVLVKGTATGAVSDFDGNYSIRG